MTANAIIFDKVTKSFGTVRAVDQVSLAFPHGALVTLLGPSGCGKTTTPWRCAVPPPQGASHPALQS